ncbi:hypothetical protein SETIT_7G063400v2 [Setaria italica]|uniref:Uncharacterized protein n=1 Tax=Setaria italica TaxID=4555 RepID=A0A368RSH5_SETIT|nr:hypothetical protein SETIT_7G063400v2 [Setaria italica]
MATVKESPLFEFHQQREYYGRRLLERGASGTGALQYVRVKPLNSIAGLCICLIDLDLFDAFSPAQHPASGIFPMLE